MKSIVVSRIWGLIGLLALAATPAFADLEVSTSVQIHATADFEAPLAAHGAWVEVGSYGRCWRPAHVTVGWRPYAVGEWVWTDCGWYWASDEPWAWACYHYGSWVYEPAFGWVWVPHVEWAPAWVSWRVGGGYIGWGPLPPRGWFSAREPKAELFVFVGEGRFGGPLRPGLFVANSAAIFKTTTLMGGVKRESRSLGGASSQKVMINQGPDLDRVQKATGRSFAPVSIREAARRTAAPAGHERAGTQVRERHDEKSRDAASDHGKGRDDSPGRGDARVGSDRGSGFGGDSDHGGSWGHGGRSSGGGRGRH